MKCRQLGESGFQVSEIALGTMTFGEQNSLSEAHQKLDYAAARCINFIDTAEMYPVPGRAQTQGRTEEYVGNVELDAETIKAIDLIHARYSNPAP